LVVLLATSFFTLSWIPLDKKRGPKNTLGPRNADLAKRDKASWIAKLTKRAKEVPIRAVILQ